MIINASNLVMNNVLQRIPTFGGLPSPWDDTIASSWVAILHPNEKNELTRLMNGNFPVIPPFQGLDSPWDNRTLS